MKGDMLISPRATVKETVDGAYMVTVDGIQWREGGVWETPAAAAYAYGRANPDEPNLNEIAKEKVGDGKKPNLYFMTVDGNTMAAFGDLDDAKEYAENYSDTLPIVIEDRLAGVVWENEASIAMQQTEEEGDARCPHTANGKHVMDPGVAAPQFRADDLVVDVTCRACGRSGSVPISPDDVNW